MGRKTAERTKPTPTSAPEICFRLVSAKRPLYQFIGYAVYLFRIKIRKMAVAVKPESAAFHNDGKTRFSCGCEFFLYVGDIDSQMLNAVAVFFDKVGVNRFSFNIFYKFDPRFTEIAERKPRLKTSRFSVIIHKRQQRRAVRVELPVADPEFFVICFYRRIDILYNVTDLPDR